MKRDCMAAEEAIWDYVREGVELPADVLRHIERCKACAQALDEVAVGMPVLRRAERCPPAPDCRAAVMAHLTAGTVAARPRRLVWALAAAVVIAAAVICGALLTPRHGQGPLPITAQDTSSAQRAVEKQPAVPSPPVTVTVAPTRTPAAPAEPAHRVKPAPAKHRGPAAAPRRGGSEQLALEPRGAQTADEHEARPEPEIDMAADVPEVAPDLVQAPEPAEAVEDTRPIAMVAVVWDPPDENAAGSYEYSETDPRTGVTTTYKVTRNGDEVKVVVESTSHINEGGNHEADSGA